MRARYFLSVCGICDPSARFTNAKHREILDWILSQHAGVKKTNAVYEPLNHEIKPGTLNKITNVKALPVPTI